jgi:hypothetical protein
MFSCGGSIEVCQKILFLQRGLYAQMLNDNSGLTPLSLHFTRKPPLLLAIGNFQSRIILPISGFFVE